LRVTVVIIESGIPTPTELETAQRSNVCGARTALASSGLSGPGPSAASRQDPGGGLVPKKRASSGVAGETHTQASPFSLGNISKTVRNPLVVIALALAIALLGLAALPKAAIPDPRLTDLLAQHRVEVALAGAAALAAAIVALALA
jgi:hypothetical protein